MILSKEDSAIVNIFENSGLRLNYWYCGKGGIPVVFFTGFGQLAHTYKKLLPALPHKYCLLVIETPILFYSRDPSCLANSLYDLLLKLELGNQLYLGGFSFGNWVAAGLIKSKLLTVKGWVLISPANPFNFKMLQLLNNYSYLNKIALKLMSSRLAKQLAIKLVSAFVKSRTKKAFILGLLRGDRAGVLMHNYLTFCPPKGKLNELFKPAKNLKIPVLILASTNDPISSSNETIKIAQHCIEDVIVQFANNQNHNPFDEEFIKQIDSFLARLSI